MPKPLLFLTVPGLRRKDVDQMPSLQKLVASGSQAQLNHSFPCVTWPGQANMLTGKLPSEHGIVSNGFFWRHESGEKKNKIEMWTAWNEVFQEPQLWDVLKENGHSTAAWFPMLSKGSGADYVCMPAPIHKPDGSEDMWCYTKPQEFYGELLEELQHFPLHHFWGPMANIKSSKWIADSATKAAEKFAPEFFYIYLPHLDYAAQKFGPDSEQAIAAVKELDQLIRTFAEGMNTAYPDGPEWIVASEYVISEVDHVTYPNRILREAGLLKTELKDGKEHIDFENTPAWALVDHQFSHVFVKDSDPQIVAAAKQALSDAHEQVLDQNEQAALGMAHERSGDLVVISREKSWQAYYWWEKDEAAPDFAHSVDIHRKPGYDPVELCFDMQTKSVPLDATLIKGSHGRPTTDPNHEGIVLSTLNLFPENSLCDLELFNRVLKHFGI